MNRYRLLGWSEMIWRLDPPYQLGSTVRMVREQPAPDGSQVWVLAPRHVLAPLAGTATPSARATDPVTAHSAAGHISARQLNADHYLVLSILYDRGALDDFELAGIATVECGYERLQTSLGVRRKELTRAGLVIDSQLRGSSPTGRPVIRWAITASGRAAFERRGAA